MCKFQFLCLSLTVNVLLIVFLPILIVLWNLHFYSREEKGFCSRIALLFWTPCQDSLPDSLLRNRVTSSPLVFIPELTLLIHHRHYWEGKDVLLMFAFFHLVYKLPSEEWSLSFYDHFKTHLNKIDLQIENKPKKWLYKQNLESFLCHCTMFDGIYGP